MTKLIEVTTDTVSVYAVSPEDLREIAKGDAELYKEITGHEMATSTYTVRR